MAFHIPQINEVEPVFYTLNKEVTKEYDQKVFLHILQRNLIFVVIRTLYSFT